MLPDVVTAQDIVKRVRITQVNMSDLTVEGMDGLGGFYFVDCALQPGVITVPNLGEDWIIRKFADRWVLYLRAERVDDEDPVATLLPGDVRINASNRILINGRVSVNGIETDLGHPLIEDETPTGVIDGTNKEFFIQTSYVSGSLDVFVNGLKTTNFTEGQQGFEFDEAPLIDSVIVVNYRATGAITDAGQDYVPGPGG